MKKIKTILHALGLVRSASPFWFFVMTLTTIFDGLFPVALVWLMRGFIDWFAQGSGDITSLYTTIGLWIGVIILQALCASLMRYALDRSVAESSDAVNIRIIEKSASFQGISQYETEEFHDTAAKMEKAHYRIENLMNNYYYFLKNCVEFITIFSMFLIFEWWIPIVIALSIIPGFMVSMRTSKERAAAEERIEEKERYAFYFKDLLISPSASKEVRIFDAFPFFKGKYNALSAGVLGEKLSFLKRKTSQDLPASIFRVIVAGGLVFYTAMKTVRGELTVGYLSLFTQSIFQFSGALFEILEFWSYLGSLEPFFSKLFDFLNLKDSYLLDSGEKKKIDTIEKIEFANVSFTYPNGKRALKNLSFSVDKGDVLALVGENGSGKTTLVKLMAGLYQPSEGAIMVNGVSLREIDPASYRRQISAVFQDYMEYALSLKENVTLAETSDEEFDAFLERTRQKMDLSFVDELAGKGDEKLGLEFGGAELSGGQWQRLAILRGLKKDNSLLLVDEPTASIDPKQEAAVFDELAGHFSGITVLVTHRLGSVRLSSKIFVLQDGSIVETGTHKDLLKLGGHYAELYNAQANMYK